MKYVSAISDRFESAHQRGLRDTDSTVVQLAALRSAATVLDAGITTAQCLKT